MIALLIVMPVLSVLSSFFQSKSLAADQTAWQHLSTTVLPGYVLTTLGLLGLIALGVVIGGVLAAWLIAVYEFPGRRWLEWSLILPLAMPAYVSGYAYTDFLQYSGPLQSALRAGFGWAHGDYWFPEIRSLGGAATMFIFVLYPYVYLLARNAFLERSPAMLDVARSLGENTWGTLWRVALPLARPAIAAGTALALMEVLADYGTVSYFGVNTLTTGIYRAWFSLGDHQGAMQLASLLLLFVLVLLVSEQSARGRARFYSVGHRLHGAPRKILRGSAAYLASLFCLIPIVLGFVLPVLILLQLIYLDWQAIAYDSHAEFLATTHYHRYLGWLGNSLKLAGITAILAVTISLLLAYALRLRPSYWQQACNRLISLGYGIPGTLIAVGILTSLTYVDNHLIEWIKTHFNYRVDLLLSGTVLALIYAYLIRFSAVSYQTIEAGLQKITPAMDASARCLGLGVWQVLQKIHTPLLWRSLLTATLLVFIDVMKELPATLILRPFNYDTLAVIAHQLATDERLNQAALPALSIVLVSLLPVMLLSRTIAR
ncbi:MAG: iron ABC transporter permease [Pseudomonadota bacterium]